MMNLVFLPATEPSDTTYGNIPEKIPSFQGMIIHKVRFPGLVWYNKSVRKEAISQIRQIGTPVVLVGFSKSGLGAWNIALEINDIVSATIIFDSPVAQKELPLWGTEDFYDNDRSWQKDLPICNFKKFAEKMPENHQLILIAGPGFYDQNIELSKELFNSGYKHNFLKLKEAKHHWNSGWIEKALTLMYENSNK